MGLSGSGAALAGLRGMEDSFAARLRNLNLDFSPLPLISSHPRPASSLRCSIASIILAALTCHQAWHRHELAMNHATKDLVIFVAGVDNGNDFPEGHRARGCAYGVFFDSTRFSDYNHSSRIQFLPDKDLWCFQAVWRVSRPFQAGSVSLEPPSDKLYHFCRGSAMPYITPRSTTT